MKPSIAVLAGVMAWMALAPGLALAASAADAELTFAIAEVRDLDTGRPLRWTFQVEGVAAARIETLRRALDSASFSEISVPENDEENDAGVYSIWFSDVRAHTIESLAARVDVITALLRKHGGSLEYQSVEEPEPAP